MTSVIKHVTFDAADPVALAGFWSAVTGRPVDEGANGYFASIAPTADAPRMLFLAVPEGKTAKNRCHLDLATADRPAEVDRLVGLGAERVGDHDEYGTAWTTLRDPEGNEFCVAAG